MLANFWSKCQGIPVKAGLERAVIYSVLLGLGPHLYCKCSFFLKFDIVLAVLTVTSLPAKLSIGETVAITVMNNLT